MKETNQKPKKRIYIAGPMRGLPEFNYPAFYAAEKELKERGYEVDNPARMADDIMPAAELAANCDLLESLMREELAAVAGCDAIYLLRGWEKSVGARRELAVALAAGLEIEVQG